MTGVRHNDSFTQIVRRPHTHTQPPSRFKTPRSLCMPRRRLLPPPNPSKSLRLLFFIPVLAVLALIGFIYYQFVVRYGDTNNSTTSTKHNNPSPPPPLPFFHSYAWEVIFLGSGTGGYRVVAGVQLVIFHMIVVPLLASYLRCVFTHPGVRPQTPLATSTTLLTPAPAPDNHTRAFQSPSCSMPRRSHERGMPCLHNNARRLWQKQLLQWLPALMWTVMLLWMARRHHHRCPTSCAALVKCPSHPAVTTALLATSAC